MIHTKFDHLFLEPCRETFYFKECSVDPYGNFGLDRFEGKEGETSKLNI